MKPNELMIGDWVRDAGRTDRPVYKRINRVDERENYCVADEYKVILGEAGMEPIPITPEILEANGIRHYKDCGRLSFYKRIDADFVIRYEIYAGYIGIELCDGNRISVDRITKVHELQHVLRLIGMNDLANNVKISKEKGGWQ